RGDLLQKLNPFAAKCRVISHETGRIAARTGETCDEAAAYWVGYIHEYDGNCLRLSNKSGNYESALTNDHVGPQINQLFCERSDFICITAPQRTSVRRLLPSVHPSFVSAPQNAVR